MGQLSWFYGKVLGENSIYIEKESGRTDKVQHLDLPGTLDHDIAAVRVLVGYGSKHALMSKISMYMS